jgi:hypothetical protein
MRRRNAALSGLLAASAALLGACAEISPTEPLLDAAAETGLFRAAAPDPAQFGGGLDAAFVRIAREMPGFGGFFYDADGSLNVVLTPAAARLSAADVAAGLRGHLEELGVDPRAIQRLRVRRGEYDFLQLDALHRRVTPLLGIGGVVFTDADEVANRVRIGVENAAAEAAVRNALAMLGVPGEAVIVSRAEPVRPMQQTIRDRVRPVGGGVQIWRQGFGIGTGCTHGFNVRAPDRPGVHGFVTNSHCTLARGTVNATAFFNHRPDVPETHIGDEVWDPPFFQGGPCPAGRNCRYSDASGQRYAPGVENTLGIIYRTLFPGQHAAGSIEIDPNNPRWFITVEQPYPVVGQTVHKVGRSTGWLAGPVLATCINTNVSGAGEITMLCQDRVEATPIGGDSGSPVFLRQGETSQVSLVGILWGGSSNTYVLSAMQNIRFENQGPVPWITYPGQTPPAPPGGPR